MYALYLNSKTDLQQITYFIVVKPSFLLTLQYDHFCRPKELLRYSKERKSQANQGTIRTPENFSRFQNNQMSPKEIKRFQKIPQDFKRLVKSLTKKFNSNKAFTGWIMRCPLVAWEGYFLVSNEQLLSQTLPDVMFSSYKMISKRQRSLARKRTDDTSF